MDQELGTSVQSQSLDNLKKLVIFRVNSEEYGIDVSIIKSIERMTEVTRVPNVNDYIIGVMNLRGSVIPVVDLRKRFGFEPQEYKEETRIIVVTLEDLEVGLVVDSCSDVTDIQQSSIEPPPTIVGGIESSYIQGVTKLDRRLIILLDIDKTIKM